MDCHQTAMCSIFCIHLNHTGPSKGVTCKDVYKPDQTSTETKFLVVTLADSNP